MALNRLDHYSIRTSDLDSTRQFYVDVLGLEDGFRPRFDFPGHWLYCGERAVVHLIGIESDDDQGLVNFLGSRSVEDSSGTGALDHIAFRATNLLGLKETLSERAIECRERTVPDLDLHLVFIEDPNGITIELNYVASEVTG